MPISTLVMTLTVLEHAMRSDTYSELLDYGSSLQKRVSLENLNKQDGTAWTADPDVNARTNKLFKCIAVGGPLKHAQSRASLAQALLPWCGDLDESNLSGALSPAFYPDGANFFIPLNPKIEQDGQHVNPVALKHAITDRDVTLLIGHTSFDDAAVIRLFSGFVAQKASAEVWLMGPGFNLRATALPDFMKTVGENNLHAVNDPAHKVHGPDCPAYPYFETSGSWQQLRELYPTALLDLNGMAAMWTSRADGSFHRQFGLNGKPVEFLFNFEASIANKIAERVGEASIANKIAERMAHNKGSRFSVSDVNRSRVVRDRVVEIVNTTLEACKNSINPATRLTDEEHCFQEKHQNFKSSQWALIFQAYRGVLDAVSTPTLMGLVQETLTETLESTLKDTFKSVEFDGFTCHMMLRKFAALEANLTPSYHFSVLRYLLAANSGQIAAVDKDIKIEDYICKLRTGVLAKLGQTGRLFILHDLGLDPNSDDYFALVLLDAVGKAEDCGARGLTLHNDADGAWTNLRLAAVLGVAFVALAVGVFAFAHRCRVVQNPSSASATSIPEVQLVAKEGNVSQ